MGSFAKQTQAHVREDDVVFTLETGGVPRQFEISGDVLRQRYGAADSSGSELLKAFETARADIEDVAKQAKWVPTDGPIDLGEGDFAGR